MNDNVTARNYVRILDNKVYPLVKRLFHESGAIFFLDNKVPIHTANVVQLWFNERVDDVSIFSQALIC